jgi:hypothetical protein
MKILVIMIMISYYDAVIFSIQQFDIEAHLVGLQLLMSLFLF